MRELETAGYEAYYVGGCVRDFVLSGMGLSPAKAGDIDVTTDATPEEMLDVFRDYRLIETGLKHGTMTVLTADGMPVEITTYRTDGDYSDHRHPDSVAFVRNLEEDLKRRDFTINAMAMDRSGNLRDPFGGTADIEKRVIRAVGDPDRRFDEDALRIMRALRFAAVLGDGAHGGNVQFTIDQTTEEAMFRKKGLLRNVSSERIYAEFKKLITGHHGGDVVRKYVDILGVVIPQLLPMKGFDQRNPYHKYDILEHCVRAMEVVRALDPEDASKVEYMKMAALFHDIGKPDTFFIGEDGIGHMYGHPARGEEIVREIMADMKADRFTTEKVALLVKYHDLVFQNDRKLLKKWMNKYGAELLLEILHIKRADNIATGNMSGELADKFDAVEQTIAEIVESSECFSIKDLAIDGRDVTAAIKEGPEVGMILQQILEEVIDGSLENDRDELLARMRELVKSLP
ncbi:MAG: HD domain-containing protein [Bacillota bacterium]|nr:HD domain-containing protein [Bacillota bacterium]